MATGPSDVQVLGSKIDSLLEGAEDHADSYFDDTSSAWEPHLVNLEDVFKRVKAANLTLMPSKCLTHIVGHIHVVGQGKVRPQPEKVRAVVEFPQPVNKTDVRAFLGLVGYYQKFIPCFSGVAAPLSDLTRKGLPTHVTWDSECNEAFQKLKVALASSPVIRNPDFRKMLYLQVDASNTGIAAVLSQRDDDGQNHPVVYESRKLLPREVAYPTMEKECLAIVWGTQKLHPYLYGRHFVIQTDHQPLTWLQQVKSKNQKLLR